jgi:hypothetical protein
VKGMKGGERRYEHGKLERLTSPNDYEAQRANHGDP